MAHSVKSELGVLLKHSAVYGLSSILSRLVGFFMIPLYTAYLTPADYGVMELLYVTTSLIAMVVGAGISIGMSRFYFDSKDPEHRNRVVSSSYIGLGGIVVPMVVILCLASRPFASAILDSADYASYFVIAFAAMGLDLLNQIGLTYFRVNKKSVAVLAASLAQLVITVVLNIYFIVELGWGVLGVFAGNLIGLGLVFAVITPYVIKKVGLRVSRKIMSELLKFGLPLIPSNVATYIVVASDRYFIKEYVSMSEAGIYSLGYKFGTLVNNFVTTPFTQIWFPRRFELFNRENSEKIFCRIFTYFTALIVFVGLIISVTSKEIVQIMADESYWQAYQIIPLITLAHIFLSFFYHFNIGIFIEKKTKYFAFINITNAILNIVLNIVLIRQIGIWGAALATTVCYLYRTGTAYYYSNRLHKILVEWKRIIILFVLAGLYYFVLSEVSLGGKYVSMILKTAICLTYPGILFVIRFFNPEEVKEFVSILVRGRDLIARRRGRGKNTPS